MDRQKMQAFKETLLKEKKELEDSVHSFDERGLGISLSQATSELSTYDNHPADVGSEVFERSKDFALRDDAMLKIRAVEDALKNIEMGKYGICDICGKEIGYARLTALPRTTLCKECKEAQERIPSRNIRPAEEDILQPPFERSFNDRVSDDAGIGYDGEDAWQDVARASDHAPNAQSGSYYGGDQLLDEDRGYVQSVEDIPCVKGTDGVIYQDFVGTDDEDSPVALRTKDI
ncbi:transcriptional regulator, TraR/DksA family [Desulfofarcimen acetoxidans DSM 771]|uniref:Transcriptional regulator, TraR/DksA family n=1 Tax=Desulfofarcimen acetoxidans (strain ATCC 49208 / DSM 771 / KCTC 5769 / VKM B-1644 / 5575) TaxID=485916 RepID=C8W4E4_DESAS|nr:TraR/DksA C4-type zinc finger protein [Desulfofarcimen acetoxidans]ACV62012.1 transcriptional regulator, TraR/DksA family [Desulfofarcimen acetoxidans DSM 771]